MIIPFLLFFASMNITLAFFSAQTAGQNSTPSTAVISVAFDETTKKVNSETIRTSTRLIPGDELILNTKIANTGTSPVYAIINFKITILKRDGSRNQVNKNYTLSGSTLTEIIGTENNYTAQAFTLEASTTTNSFAVKYKFNGDVYDNSYKQASITSEVKVNAIQTTALTTEEATNILMQTADNETVKIVGNTVVSGTPSIASPATIQSVGDKTVNLLDVNRGFVQSHSTYQTTIADEKLIVPYSGGNSFSGEHAQYIDVENGQNYTISFNLVQGKARILLRLYDENKNIINDSSITLSKMTYHASYLGYFYDSNNLTISFPSNVKYIRIGTCAMNTSSKDVSIYENYQIEKGSTATTYEPYGYKIPIAVQGKNLFNLNTITSGKNLNANTGELYNSSVRSVSD